MRASSMAAVLAALLTLAFIAPAASQGTYIGVDDEGFIEFETIEDSAVWDGELPEIDENAVAYFVSCFPKKSDLFEMDENSNFRYRPAPDEFSRNPSDKDVFSYHGRVPGAIGLANPDKYDCQSMDAEGGLCRTELRLVRIFIHPVNDAPVAADGASFLAYVNPTDLMEPNQQADDNVRLQLGYPFTLTRELVGSDVDGDRLFYTIEQQPEHGVAFVVEDNTFKYVPDANFAGEDIFVYRVDDRLGGGKCMGGNCPNDPALFSTAKVIVQVSGVSAAPSALDSTQKLFEDNEVVGKMVRGAFSGNNNLLRYEITNVAAFGQVLLLCDGREVYDPLDCRDTVNETAIALGEKVPERAAYYLYEPREDYFSPLGADGEQQCDFFSFRIILEGLETDVEPDAATVSLCVDPVNDPPIVRAQNISTAMNPGPDFPQSIPVNGSISSPLILVAEDVEGDSLTIRITRGPTVGGCVGSSCYGRIYTTLDGEFNPVGELFLPAGGFIEVPATNGSAVLHYVAPPLLRGAPAEILLVRAFDGLAYSTQQPVWVNVECLPGFRRGAVGTESENICIACRAGEKSEAKDSFSCAPCGLGTFSVGATGFCVNCPEGTYNDIIGPDFNGTSQCLPCPGFTTSQEQSKAITECFCVPGYYGENGVECIPCPNPGPADASLNQDADFVRPWTYCDEFGLRWPQPQPGFYVDTSTAAARGIAEVKECAPRESCIGFSTADRNGTVASRIFTGATCNPGYQGLGCAFCMEDYYRSGEECLECPARGSFGLILWALLLILFLPLIAKSGKLAKYWTVIDVTLSYTQVCGVFAFYYFNWPRVLFRFFRFSSAFNLNLELLHIECNYEWNFKDKWVTTMMIPLYVALFFLLLNFLTFLVMIFQRTKGKELRAKYPNLAKKKLFGVNYGVWITGRVFKTDGVFAGKSKEDFKKMARTSIRSYLAFLLIAYVLLCIGTFSMFDCVESEVDGLDYLQAAPHIQCYNYDTNKVWGELFPWAVLCVFLYPVGILGLFFTLLYMNRNKLDLPEVRDLLGFAIDPLKNERYYYIIIRLLRLFMLTVCTTFNFDTSSGGALRQAVVAVLTMMLAQALKASLSPFLNPRHDLMEMIALLSSFFTLMCGITYLSARVSDGFRTFLTVVNIITIIATYVFFAFMILTEIFPKLLEKIRNYRYLAQQSGIIAALKGGGKNKDVNADPNNAPGSGPTFLHPGMSALPVGMKRFLTPNALEVLFDVPTSDRDAEMHDLFRALDEDYDTKLQLLSTDKSHVLFRTFLKPRFRREIIGGICARDQEENRVVLDWIEDVMLRDDDNRYAVAYSKAKVDMLEEKLLLECTKIARDKDLAVEDVLASRRAELGMAENETFADLFPAPAPRSNALYPNGDGNGTSNGGKKDGSAVAKDLTGTTTGTAGFGFGADDPEGGGGQGSSAGPADTAVDVRAAAPRPDPESAAPPMEAGVPVTEARDREFALPAADEAGADHKAWSTGQQGQAAAAPPAEAAAAADELRSHR